ARLAAGPRVSLGREDSPLLVPREDRPDPITIPRECLVQRHAGAAGISENHFHAVPYERFDQNVGPGSRFRDGLRPAIVNRGHGRPRLGVSGKPGWNSLWISILEPDCYGHNPAFATPGGTKDMSRTGLSSAGAFSISLCHGLFHRPQKMGPLAS